MENLFENQDIVDINIEDSVKASYLDYSMSVIIGRALPDAKDGLKLFIEEFYMQCMI